MTHSDYQDLAALDAVGALDENEIVELHRHLAECEECQLVERDYHESAAMFALGLEPVAAPERARSAVMKAVSATAPLIPESNVVEIRRRPPWWLAAAAIFFLALFGWSELRIRALREQVSELAAARDAAAEENRRLATSNHQLAQQVSDMSSPANRTIDLVGQTIAPSSKAKVFMNERERSAVVFFQNLPMPAPDKTYQLWVIRAGATAADPAGTFDVDPSGTAHAQMKNLPLGTEIKAIAVTLEPKGGMPAPTGEKYLVGTL